MQATGINIRKSLREVNKILNQLIKLVPKKDKGRAQQIADSLLIIVELRMLELSINRD